MEHIRHFNEIHPLSTEVGTNPNFIKNRVKELKRKPEINMDIDGTFAIRKIKVLSITKAKVETTVDNLGEEVYHFSCKAKIRLLD